MTECPVDLLKRFFRSLRPPLFTIRVKNGSASLSGGAATPAFVRDCSAVASASDIRQGWIWGTRSRGRFSLDFSSGIGEKDRQRFRNIAGVHR
jgi:hypothetical protein